MKHLFTFLLLFTYATCFAAPFKEYPIGDEVEKNQMLIAAVYLPPVTMDHDMEHEIKHDDPSLLKKKEEYQIHLEADIHATKGNRQGFGAGEWIPFLSVNYKLINKKSKVEIVGNFSPMVAKDGPHYGATIMIPGKGEYDLTYTINPPNSNDFGRHTDKVTGVAPWWKPFKVSFKFDFNGFE